MKITLNGYQKDITPQASLKDIIGRFYKDSNHVIAELNGTIIKNHEWAKATIQEGDTLELVNFVAGG